MNSAVFNIYWFNHGEVAMYLNGALWHWGIVADDWWKSLREQVPEQLIHVHTHTCNMTLQRDVAYIEANLRTE